MTKKITILLGLSVILLLSACDEFEGIESLPLQVDNGDEEAFDAIINAPYVPGICSEDKIQRPCTEEEQQMVNSINAIIKKIKNYRDEDNRFLIGRENSPNPRVLLFGEIHDSMAGKLATFGYLNMIAQRSDLLLLEGKDRRRDTTKLNCAFSLIWGLYNLAEAKRFGIPYHVDFAKLLATKKDYSKLLKNTASSYDLKSLELAKLRCGFWDDKQAFKREISYRTLKQRNKAMVEAIQIGLGDNNVDRVIVSAGAHHLPLGEWHSAMVENAKARKKVPKKYSEYYDVFKRERKRVDSPRAFSVRYYMTTTKPIYQYFMRYNIPFAEFLHSKMVSESDERLPSF